MRRYPHCKASYRVAFYGLLLALLVVGVVGREASLSGSIPAASSSLAAGV